MEPIMPSPFPGMNPYLEHPDVWHDFHKSVMVVLRDSLVRQLRPTYFVGLNPNEYIRDGIKFNESHLRVIETASREVVAEVELISIYNKEPGPDRDHYLAIRNERFSKAVGFVEIDLLRAGPRMPVQGLAACDYVISVSRAGRPNQIQTWSFFATDSLPIVPLPMTGTEADAVIDLKTAIDRVYDSAGYQDWIYESPVSPPIRPKSPPGPRTSSGPRAWP